MYIATKNKKKNDNIIIMYDNSILPKCLIYTCIFDSLKKMLKIDTIIFFKTTNCALYSNMECSRLSVDFMILKSYTYNK